uniref:Phosphoinositide phospholipase C n=1 Tax=Eptatretus burgeri TaxID=7764 RepID=A0A8C4Q6K7_EPTBU
MASPPTVPTGETEARRSVLTQAEEAKLMRTLELGAVMTLLSGRRGRPERRTFQVFATRAATNEPVNDDVSYPARPPFSVDLREVREVRRGAYSDRTPDDYEASTCFVVLHGSEFRLKFLSIAGQNHEDVQTLILGLRWIVKDTRNSSSPLQIERWLRKQFYTMDRTKAGRWRFHKACLYHDFVPSRDFLRDRFCLLSLWMLTSGHCVPVPSALVEMLKFLIHPMQESWAGDAAQVSDFVTTYLHDQLRHVQEPYLTLEEFLTFLFSWENSICEFQIEHLSQESMDNPLSHYWISSSHNTYLTGDQFSSESSTEAYARCLRMGCRCIECTCLDFLTNTVPFLNPPSTVDCWDGPEETPIIYHGHTLTSKIRFLDVITTIKEHAFATSDYPVILSIEDHCTISQQRRMAYLFRQVFEDMLLTKPIDMTSDELPTPNQLRHKIILKHKTIESQGSEENPGSECDLSNSLKNGILYLEDPIDHGWNPHYFVLTHNCIYYSEETAERRGLEEDETGDLGDGEKELHSNERWFHGRLAAGRRAADQLLMDACAGDPTRRDGTFLVRESGTFVGDYTLSFWRAGRVQHCRIHSQQKGSSIRYYLTENLLFDSIYSLVLHYRTVPLRCDNFELCLTEPAPQPDAHEAKEWYHHNLSRGEAEHMLMHVPRDGAFLVRRRTDSNSYAITFRAEGKIKHCRIQREGRLFLLGTSAEFESLIDLVSYFEKHLLYRKMRLRYPISTDALKRLGTEDPDYSSVYGPLHNCTYVEPNHLCMVKALYDYKSQSEGELSFAKNSIIYNVHKQDGHWWRGDRGGKKQLLFPANFVEEIVSARASEDEVDSVIIFCVFVKKCLRRNEEEKRKRVASEISELVIYCRPVPFEAPKLTCREMSSLPETKNQRNMTRIYPKGQRIDSSNYDPLPAWACGAQMVALNFQTSDKSMQLNQALFSLSGGSGYVLQSAAMRSPRFDPLDPQTLPAGETLSLQIMVFGARHLPKNGRSIACPFLEVEVCGSEYDCTKYKTEVVQDNGLNPVWLARYTPLVFDVQNPGCAFLRFAVFEEDMFSDPNFLAQATFPVKSIRTGFRSVPLKNSYSEDLELSSLLVHIAITNIKEDQSLYTSIKHLRERAAELTLQLHDGEGDYERDGEGDVGIESRATIHSNLSSHMRRLAELRNAEEQLVQLTTRRSQRYVRLQVPSSGFLESRTLIIISNHLFCNYCAPLFPNSTSR